MMKKIFPHKIDHQQKRYKLIACEIMFREVCYLLSQTENVVDVVFMQKGLHDLGKEKMLGLLQEELDKVEPDKYDAILLGYGLCNNGVWGLNAHTQLVIPRAHDCITFFMGSKERYKDYFGANPGTYYKTSGWVERETGLTPQGVSVMESLGINKTYEEYVQEYGEENAKFIMETLGSWTDNYTKMIFIDMTAANESGAVISFGNSDLHKRLTQEKAEEMGWAYEEMAGDIRLIRKLIDGDWDEDEFLIVPPGSRIIPTNTDTIIAFE
jgi:hypothetical protein